MGYGAAFAGDAKTDDLIDRGRSEIDPAKRRAIYRELELYFRDTASTIMLAQPSGALNEWNAQASVREGLRVQPDDPSAVLQHVQGEVGRRTSRRPGRHGRATSPARAERPAPAGLPDPPERASAGPTTPSADRECRGQAVPTERGADPAMRVEREKLGDWFIYGREVAWKYSLTSVGRPAARFSDLGLTIDGSMSLDWGGHYFGPPALKQRLVQTQGYDLAPGAAVPRQRHLRGELRRGHGPGREGRRGGSRGPGLDPGRRPVPGHRGQRQGPAPPRGERLEARPRRAAPARHRSHQARVHQPPEQPDGLGALDRRDGRHRGRGAPARDLPPVGRDLPGPRVGRPASRRPP